MGGYLASLKHQFLKPYRMKFTLKKGKERILDTVNLILIAVLLYAAVNKFIHYQSFRFELNLTPAIKGLVKHFVWMIPGIEFLISLLLMINKTRILALYLSIIIFSTYLFSMFTLRMYVPNIRGGILDRLTFNQYIIANSILLILAIIGIFSFYISRSAIGKEDVESHCLG